jgi:PhnB protein
MNTNMTVQPYLFFEGRAQEAIDFYTQALGAQTLFMMRFKDAPADAGCGATPGSENKIMHATIRIGSADVMISDGRNSGKAAFDGFSLSVNASTEAEAKKLFGALSEGGQVIVPLGKTFFSPAFGMTQDKFGVTWMVIIPVPMG